MRNVVSNSEVTHLWANRRQYEATNSSGSIYFRDDTIFSYGSHFPMARHIDLNTVLVTSRSYSVTTSKHLSLVRYAVNHKNVFYVDNVKARTKEEHRANLAAMRAEYETTLVKASRARTNAQYLLGDAEHTRERANAYSKYFKLGTRIKQADVSELTARAKKQRAKEIRARNARRAEQARRQADALARWRNGESVNVYSYGAPVALRIVGDDVQTSRGVKFPLSHAMRALPLIHACVKTGRAWWTNGHKIPMGVYQLDGIAANGDVKAGCHFVKYAEIKHFETLLNK